MPLREVLGTATDMVHERVDSLLDSEDAMIILVDDARAISYAHGFGLSPSQLELLALEVERAVRRVAGPSKGNRKKPRNAAGGVRLIQGTGKDDAGGNRVSHGRNIRRSHTPVRQRSVDGGGDDGSTSCAGGVV